MNMRKVLEQNIPGNIRFDEWPRAVEHLAPIIERALRAAYKQAADDYNETAPEGCLAVCTSTENGITAGVAAMMEKPNE